ncbi:MAG TPA: permease-like cell division protein FtsX [Acidimicrobiia bacterium]|nr:permease-like cell division protein FtsX [Acidimicrobiia bacterium]
MMAKLGYFARETLISLRRNLLMTLAGILTVTVSLFLFGGIMLLSRVVDHGTQKWKGGVEEEIFMKPTATQDQIDNVQRRLTDDPLVKRFTFISQEEALGEAKKLFQNRSDLFESLGPEDLPSSFRVVPERAEDTEVIADRFRTQPGVDEINTASKAVKSLLTFTNWVRYLFIGLSLVLLASSLFLIVNTIRLATFARRREIEIMKLVGASNWFVRVPFMAEGLVQGLLGAGLAFGGVYTLKVLLAGLLENPADFFEGWYVTSGDAGGIGIVVLLLGAAIGLVGSLVGLRRFVRT